MVNCLMLLALRTNEIFYNLLKAKRALSDRHFKHGISRNRRSIGLRLCLLTLLFLAFGTLNSAAENRVALVIGNSNYKNVARLSTPANDAKDIAAVLEGLGYDVILRRDVGSEDLQASLRKLAEKSGESDIAIVYYAGYAASSKGEMYLIPVDAEFAAQKSSRREMISLHTATSAVSGARSLGLVLFDGMRENPFEAKLEQYEGTFGSDATLEPTKTGRSASIFFAAEPGKFAEEGNGRNSPFASAILKYLLQPNLEISFFFRSVRDDVRRSTGQKQTPYMYGQLSGAKVFLSTRTQENLREPDRDTSKTNLCDELATDPEGAKTGQPAHGLKVDDIKVSDALNACSEAVNQFPEIDRFHYQLGRAFFAARNYSSALLSYKRAFELGNIPALYALGEMYEKGTGVDKDPARARFYYETASEMNFPPAILSLGILYEQGSGVARKPEMAYRFYKRAADLGSPRAINMMAQLTEKGLGTARDAKQARGLYERGAALGDSAAMLNLARCFADGIGGRKDVSEARQLLEKASLSGSVEARELLARLGKSKGK